MDPFELLKKLAEGAKNDRQKNFREVYDIAGNDILLLMAQLSSVPVPKDQRREDGELNEFGMEALPVYIASLMIHASLLYSKDTAELGKIPVSKACLYNTSYLCIWLKSVLDSITTTVCGCAPEWEKKD